MRVKLQPVERAQSISSAIPANLQILFAKMTDGWADAPGWQARAGHGEAIMRHFRDHGPLADREQTRGLFLLTTALLEQLGETHISGLDQAFWYRFSAHAQWRAAAMNWFTMTSCPLECERWALSHPATIEAATRHSSVEGLQ